MIRAYLAGSVLAVAILGGCMALCLLGVWALRAVEAWRVKAKARLEAKRQQYRNQQAWRLRASRRYLRKFDETHK